MGKSRRRNSNSEAGSPAHMTGEEVNEGSLTTEIGESMTIRTPKLISAHMTLVFDDGTVTPAMFTRKTGAEQLEIEIRNAANKSELAG